MSDKRPGRAMMVVLAGAAAVWATAGAAEAQGAAFSDVTPLGVPAAIGSREPYLSATEDGRILMSWTEPAPEGYAVRVAVLDGTSWSDPRTVVAADDLFVNWADFPSAVALPDGTLAAHWLRVNGDADYAYDVNIAMSGDEGRSWGEVLVPHLYATQRQHGFATLLPVAPDRLLAFWLDGRDYDTTGTFAAGDSADDAMQLRVATVAPDGATSDEILLDARTCTCCTTSATVTDGGTVLVAYRDRTQDEIRDISLLRLADRVWSDPMPVSDDGWQIEGCPINGPSIDSNGGRTALAWFSAAQNVPVVKLAFSDDDGRSFGEGIRIDRGAPSGRVDVLQMADGSAVVSWLENTAVGEALFLCKAMPQEGCGRPKIVAISPAGRTTGFPRMAAGPEGVYVAWTEPTASGTGSLDEDVRVRMVLARLGATP